MSVAFLYKKTDKSPNEAWNYHEIDVKIIKNPSFCQIGKSLGFKRF